MIALELANRVALSRAHEAAQKYFLSVAATAVEAYLRSKADGTEPLVPYEQRPEYVKAEADRDLLEAQLGVLGGMFVRRIIK